MDDEINSIQVAGRDEGDRLIDYLSSEEVWVTPFVIEKDSLYYVKASIPEWELHRALMYIREGEN